MDLKDATGLAYNDSMQCDVRNKRKALLGDVNPLYLSDEKEDADYKMSKNTVTVQMTGVGDENSSIDLLPD